MAQCKKCPFSILCDEGNDNDEKNLVFLVQFWDDKLIRPMMWFLDMPVCNIGTVEKLFDTNLTEKGLVWSSVVGF